MTDRTRKTVEVVDVCAATGEAVDFDETLVGEQQPYVTCPDCGWWLLGELDLDRNGGPAITIPPHNPADGRVL